MFRFTREKILPLFLQKRISIAELAKSADVHQKTAANAIHGLPVSSKVVDKIATALGVNALLFLEKPQSSAV